MSGCLGTLLYHFISRFPEIDTIILGALKERNKKKTKVGNIRSRDVEKKKKIEEEERRRGEKEKGSRAEEEG